MIPNLDPFSGVTFNDLSDQHERFRRAELCLETFGFDECDVAFKRGGAWAKFTQWEIGGTIYHLGSFCATYAIDTKDIGIDNNQVYFRGQNQRSAIDRRDLYEEFIIERHKKNHSTNHGNEWPLIPDFAIFASYQEFYPMAEQHQTHQRREDVYLVFGIRGIMSHLTLTDQIDKFGWAMWKYIDQNIPCVGIHPYWSFEPKRPETLVQPWTQGSGYEYTLRILPERNGQYLKSTTPAFMFYDREKAYAFRTFLDTLGLYDHESVKYDSLDPVPIFPTSWASTSTRSQPIIRGANFQVV